MNNRQFGILAAGVCGGMLAGCSDPVVGEWAASEFEPTGDVGDAEYGVSGSLTIDKDFGLTGSLTLEVDSEEYDLHAVSTHSLAGEMMPETEKGDYEGTVATTLTAAEINGEDEFDEAYAEPYEDTWACLLEKETLTCQNGLDQVYTFTKK